MQLTDLSHHIPRVRHQLGKPLQLGGLDYRVRGYLANRQAVTLGHEPHLMPPLRRALEACPGPFVDVGVNTGQTLLKVLAIDPDRSYFGFEPQIGCCFCVQQFITDNNLTHARIMPIALSDHDGMAGMHAEGLFDEMASLHKENRTTEAPVAVRKGDGVLHELGCLEPGLIKIDVEGAELEVLRGLGSTLARVRPILFFEVLPNFTGEDRIRVSTDIATENTRRASEIWALLTELGYTIRQIDNLGDENLISGFDLDDRMRFKGRDYIAVHRI